MRITDFYDMRGWIVVSPKLIMLACAIFFFLGWLFPVEGPLDFVYDNHVKKTPTKAAPLVKVPVIEDLEDPCDVIEQQDPYFLLYCGEAETLD